VSYAILLEVGQPGAKEMFSRGSFPAMIPPEVVIVPVVFGIPGAVLIVRMWFRHKEKMAELGRGTGSSREMEARLERIEQAMEAMAIEMERVGEGQRFVTKLMAERGAAPQLPSERE
jgi:hypothetical protein